MSPNTRPVILLGPTASGKTALAEALASALPLRLISADSMQVYRGMDIGTSKPAPATRGMWSLLDLAEPGEPFSVGDWLRAAQGQLALACAQGQRPLVCGGTGLYLSALAEGLADIPPVGSEVRAELEQRLAQQGLAAMGEELKAKDPELARGLDLRNPRRVLRGLEVLQATGKPLSWWQAQPRQGGLGSGSLLWLGLDPGLAELEQRIQERSLAMLEQGWLDEAKGLRSRAGEAKVRATGAIGYAEAYELLDGRLSAAQAAAAIQLKTRRYAKRQRTWFRRMPGILWLDARQGLAQALKAIENPA